MKRRKIVRLSLSLLQICLLAFVLTSSAAVWAESLSEPSKSAASKQSGLLPTESAALKYAHEALSAHQYNQYVQRLEKAGTEGDEQCEYELAELYYEGRIVSQDRKKALTIWQNLTANKYALATCQLGRLYKSGEGVPQDYKKAVALFLRAAESGCDLGTYELIFVYRDGLGCKSNYAKAAALAEQLCAKHSPLGWQAKSALLWEGLGVKKNTKQALALLTQAAQAGRANAQYVLSHRYREGHGVDQNLKLSRYWAQKGSEQGDVDCQTRLAYMLTQGEGGPKDCAGGISILQALADQSVLEAENQLGYMYHSGTCLEKDNAKAKMWLEKAAARGYGPSQNELANIYFDGDGVAKDLKKSFELNMKSALQHYPAAEYNVGMAYDYGYGVQVDAVKARYWYEKAVVQGNPHACNNLSLIYLEGRGVAKSSKLAMSLRRKGVENGCWMACTNLGEDYLHGTNGVKRDDVEAARLFKKSAELKAQNPQANFELAKLHEGGIAGKRDLKLADKYYREAAKYHYMPALNKLGLTGVLTFNLPVERPKHQSAFVQYTIDPTTSEFFKYVPESYDKSKPYGLIVYVPCFDKMNYLPSEWGDVLDRRHFLFVCPQNAGSSQYSAADRAGKALLGALEMMRKYNIDSSRVYAMGAYDGARVASNLAFNQSDVFRGTILSCSAAFYRAVPKHDAKDVKGDGGQYGVCKASPEEIADARANAKFVLITGKGCSTRGNILDIYNGGFVVDKFHAKLIEFDGIAHNECDGKTLEQALDFLK